MRLKLLVVVLGLVASACGDDDGGSPNRQPDASIGGSGDAGGSDGGPAAPTGGMGGMGGASMSPMDASSIEDASVIDAGRDAAHDSDEADDAGRDDEDSGTPDEVSLVREWPTDDLVIEVDGVGVFGTDVSGVIYQPNGAGPGVLWAVMNLSPTKMYRLEKSGATWIHTVANGWDTGKELRMPDGIGVPDSEGVTKADYAADVVYVGSERNLSSSGTSRNAVLAYDVSGAAASLTAQREWNLTDMLPSTGANLGIEALTFIPDAALVAEDYVDESTDEKYDPLDYPTHGTGLFAVGLESRSQVFFFALGSGGEITHIGSAETGLDGVMSLEYDRDVGYLWAYCDDACGNRAVILTVDGHGEWKRRAELERPDSMPDINNEGIAIGPESECVAGKKPFFWIEDRNNAGHALRAGTIPCGTFL